MAEDRRTLHGKQNRMKMSKGNPRKQELTEGSPEFRFIDGQLEMVVKYKGKSWYFKGENKP